MKGNKAPVRVLYFARLGEQLGCREETLTLPDQITTVDALRSWLIRRGDVWDALRDDTIRIAVNQDIVKQDAPVTAGDEVAFFPPVTGG